MRKQLYYEMRALGTLRLVCLVGIILLNAALVAIFGYGNILGMPGRVLSVTLSSVALGAVVIAAIVLDIDAMRRLFVTPSAYAVHLTPSRGYHLLGSRLIIAVVQDVFLLFFGILGVVLQAMVLGNPSSAFQVFADLFAAVIRHPRISLFVVGIVLLSYTQLLATIYFGATLSRTLFASKRGRVLLSVLATIAASYVLSLLNAALLPFADSVGWYGLAITAHFHVFTTPALVAILAIQLVRTAALFISSSLLIERRINL